MLTAVSGELIGTSRSPPSGLAAGNLTHPFTRFLQLKILRQLVEHVLCNSQQVREILDRAWGIKHMQHKKKEGETAPPDADDPMSQEHLVMEPIGQDKTKLRYWIVDGQLSLVVIPVPSLTLLLIFVCSTISTIRDFCLSVHAFFRVLSLWITISSARPWKIDSPRLYASTNPWKMSSSFTAISSTQEEYLKALEDIRATAPPAELAPGERRSKVETAHLQLITVMENRIPAIEAELNVGDLRSLCSHCRESSEQAVQRIQKLRKKIEQRNLQLVQSQVRGVRTRTQTRRPDYVFNDGVSEVRNLNSKLSIILRCSRTTIAMITDLRKTTWMLTLATTTTKIPGNQELEPMEGAEPEMVTHGLAMKDDGVLSGKLTVNGNPLTPTNRPNGEAKGVRGGSEAPWTTLWKEDSHANDHEPKRARKVVPHHYIKIRVEKANRRILLKNRG